MIVQMVAISFGGMSPTWDRPAELAKLPQLYTQKINTRWIKIGCLFFVGG
jgi:hypothetical protein